MYPQAFQVRPVGPQSQLAGSSAMQFSLQDPLLIIQFFANMQALYRSMQQ